MKTLGNIIWILFGGFVIAIEYVIGSLLNDGETFCCGV
jgi:uncharacterized membrane protein YccF (DUF307 family)